MRPARLLLVAGVFIVVSLMAAALIHVTRWDARDFAMAVGAIVASQVGVVMWHRQAPETPERTVKLRLGALLAVTAVVFSLAFQALTGWLAYPEVTIPIITLGCFAFPFAIVGPLWKALGKDTAR